MKNPAIFAIAQQQQEKKPSVPVEESKESSQPEKSEKKIAV